MPMMMMPATGYEVVDVLAHHLVVMMAQRTCRSVSWRGCFTARLLKWNCPENFEHMYRAKKEVRGKGSGCKGPACIMHFFGTRESDCSTAEGV